MCACTLIYMHASIQVNASPMALKVVEGVAEVVMLCVLALCIMLLMTEDLPTLVQPMK